MGKQLRYKHRLSAQEIRLLDILPAPTREEPLQCRLRQIDLQNAPPYEAMSYVWGDSTAVERITCDDSILVTTKNLCHALKRVRLRDAVRTVWADAICINQEDLEERGNQVALMTQVYTKAQRVVVWLGVDPEGVSYAANETLRTVFEACMQHQQKWREAEDISNNDLLHDAYNFYRFVELPVDIYDVLAWKALKALFDCSWFRRTWCIQEIRIPKQAICFWGDGEVHWQHVSTVASWLEDTHDPHDFVPGFFPEDVEYEFASFMIDVLEDKSLLSTLLRFRPFLASDKRDKVYGLLNMVEPKDEAAAIRVDYKSSVKDVYRDAALQCIRSSSTLDVLAYVEHASDFDGNDGFHSWTPRWDQSTRSLGLTNRTGEMRWNTLTAKLIEDAHTVVTQDGVLYLSGMLFGRVASIGTLLDDLELEEMETSGSTHPILAWWNEMLTGLESASAKAHRAIRTMAITLTAEMDASFNILSIHVGEDRDGIEGEHSRRFFADYLTFVDNLFRSTGQKNTTSCQPLSMSSIEGDADRYKSIAWKICDQRRICKMDNGSYGLGPACMREGDVAVTLLGGECACILRPVDQHFYFMGLGYIEDAMRVPLPSEEWACGRELQKFGLC